MNTQDNAVLTRVKGQLLQARSANEWVDPDSEHDAKTLRQKVQAKIEELLGKVEDEGRSHLHASEERAFSELKQDLAPIDRLLEQIDEHNMSMRRDELAGNRAQRDAANAVAATLPPPGGYRSNAIRVGGEKRTYAGAPNGPSFFRDLYTSQRFGDPAAHERLARHQAETLHEHRAATTSALGGFVPPSYLIGNYAAIARAGRTTADLCTRLPLPTGGSSVQISRITTGTAVASQATENTTVQNTDIDDTLLSIPVVTIAGQQDVSRQLLERSEGPVDEVIFADLAAAYATELGRQIINGDGTNGTHLGLLPTSGVISVTYTDASPTVVELLPKIADATQQIQTLRYAGPTAIVMHPRRWAWFLTALDTSNRPLITPAAGGPNNAAGVNKLVGYGEPVGELAGLPVYTDANIPTNLGAGNNEDRIIVAHWPDHMIWEGDASPFALRFDDALAGQLTVKLVAYGYSAFTAARYPKATAVVSGTGLVPPTF